MLKIFQASLQQYVNCELPDVQAGFRKDRRSRDQSASNCWKKQHRKNKKVPEKKISALLTIQKHLTV